MWTEAVADAIHMSSCDVRMRMATLCGCGCNSRDPVMACANDGLEVYGRAQHSEDRFRSHLFAWSSLFFSLSLKCPF